VTVRGGVHAHRPKPHAETRTPHYLPFVASLPVIGLRHTCLQIRHQQIATTGSQQWKFFLQSGSFADVNMHFEIVCLPSSSSHPYLVSVSPSFCISSSVCRATNDLIWSAISRCSLISRINTHACTFSVMVSERVPINNTLYNAHPHFRPFTQQDLMSDSRASRRQALESLGSGLQSSHPSFLIPRMDIFGYLLVAILWCVKRYRIYR